jgi:diguanylate cyclase (GGDEF)-like protein
MRKPTEHRTPPGIQRPGDLHPFAEDAANTAPLRLQQPLSDPEQLGRVHTISQQQWRQELQALRQTNSRLRQDMLRLTQEVALVRHFAYHDELTGLPNRSLLLDRLNQAVIQAARGHKQMGLLLLDLDGFKSVNDQLGHAAGDEVLRQVATRIARCIRGGDTACRYGGDEFVVMLPEIDGETTAAAVAEKIRLHLAVSYDVDDKVISLTASIGVACYPRDGKTPSDLLEQSDTAMYRAKEHRTAR